MIEALAGASSLQLYQFKALIEGMLADPRRGIDPGLPFQMLRHVLDI